AFMAIKKVLTTSGRQATYDAGRNNETGHADLAWACMHAMDFEPLEGASEATTSVLEFS
ncbi:MAG TPA: terminase, partial [Acidovorax sp.]|nr:terminase [Acidovorax sp.]